MKVLVIGSGIAGLLHIQLAQAAGAARVIAVDINASRLDAAKKLGADVALTPGNDFIDRLKECNDGRLAELVIVSTGAASAVGQAFHAVDRGGTILFFAPSDPGASIEMPFNELWRKEVTMTTSYAGSPRDITVAMELISSGKLSRRTRLATALRLRPTRRATSARSCSKPFHPSSKPRSTCT